MVVIGVNPHKRQHTAAAAIVDRVTFGGNIIETGTTSYPLALNRAQRAGTVSDR